VDTNSTPEKQPEDSAGDGTHSAKEPYVKPDVRFEHVFETRALACGKVQVFQGSCRFNRRAS
jgi:hypothetical protein